LRKELWTRSNIDERHLGLLHPILCNRVSIGMVCQAFDPVSENKSCDYKTHGQMGSMSAVTVIEWNFVS
jgi:hypothetical protein